MRTTPRRYKIVLDGDQQKPWIIFTDNPGNPKKGKDRSGLVLEKYFDGRFTTLTLYPFTASSTKLMTQLRITLVRTIVCLQNCLR
jgi:hypothetical protein